MTERGEGVMKTAVAGPAPAVRRLPWVRGRASVLERAAMVIAGLMVLIAVAGPLVAPHDPYAVDLGQALNAPSASHWFGTDANGRDILSRVLHGAGVSLLATVIVIAVATLIGTLLGTLAALGGRVVDEIIMRICDIGLSLPAIILALGLAAALGPGLRSAVIALCLTWWPGYARLVRSLVRDVKDAEYVEAARTLGVPAPRLIVKHILPNALNTLYVQTTLDVSAVMLVISGLSFVGVGAQAPSAEWGAMIAAAANNITGGWWAVLFPGLAIVITAISFNLLGDWLRVRNDPTLREAR
ncbi:ABC transporter permease [Actinomadura sp. SCN-SB]|uniref:ABC transporter permease n=1 Tax=Actinomadura sp. SCN-SB TaxID=3373092 RepID=UPI0037534DE2